VLLRAGGAGSRRPMGSEVLSRRWPGDRAGDSPAAQTPMFSLRVVR
jgi:hypothetical protein